MSEFFMRNDAPLTEHEWEHLQKAVINAARQLLVGRRFIEVVGPLGAGVETVPVGSGEKRQHIPLQLIQEDFTLVWREIAAHRQTGLPLQTGPAARAALACAQQEDQMIFGKLLQDADKVVQIGSWDEGETPLSNVVAATEALVADNFFGPYAVVLSPALYTQMQRIARGGRLISKLVADVATGGLFRSPLLESDQGMVLSLGSYNFDLVLGQDLTIAYMGNEELDHLFRVIESLALRVKRPGAVCRLTAVV